MLKKKVAYLGVCPIGKFVFSHEDAVKWKKEIFKKFKEWDINYCDVDNILPDGMVRDQKHVEAVVDYFKKEKIDALFIPHCNFGTEGAAAMIAKEMKVPVLLWGPRDEAPLPDGSRLRDSLCGMFATSGVLHKLNIPFTYIENCMAEDEKFKKGVHQFIKAASVVKAIDGMKIGQIGVRVDFFWSTIMNEKELLENFNIQLFPFDMVDFIKGVKERAKKDYTKYKKEQDEIQKWLKVEGLDVEDPFINSLAYRDELTRLAQEFNLDAFSIKNFSSIQDELGSGLGLADTLYGDTGVPVACESDFLGAISSVILEAAADTSEPSFFPEFTIRHPDNDNAVLLWHGDAPLSLRDPKSEIKMVPPSVLKDLPPTNVSFKLKDGPLTVCRFENLKNGEYVLGVGEGKTVDGPYTGEIYAWMEVDDWPHWEKVLMEGPYIHHCSAIYEHCANILVEACKYIPDLKVQRFEKNI